MRGRCARWRRRCVLAGLAAVLAAGLAVAGLGAAAQAAGELHGNVQSRIFHAPHCRYYACKACTAVFATREAALKAGYRPCKVCRP